MSRLVSIVIPCFGERPYTELCVESIRAHTQDVPWELILVDNGSGDDTAEWAEALAHTDSRIRLVRLHRNTGFARGVNAGLARARGTELVVLNNDAVVTPNWLSDMLRLLDDDPAVGVVGPMCNYIAGPQRVKATTYDDDLEEMQAFAARWRAAHRGEFLAIPRIVGFCMVIRRAVIDAIGGFDAVFGNGNFEDDDFCVRAQLAGFGLRIAGGVFVHHFGSRTFIAMGMQEADGSHEAYKRAIHGGWDRFVQKWGFNPDAPFKEPGQVLALPFDASRHVVPLLEPVTFRLPTTAPDWPQALVAYVERHPAHTPAYLFLETGDASPEALAQAEQRAVEALQAAGHDPALVPDIDIVPKVPGDSADVMTWTYLAARAI